MLSNQRGPTWNHLVQEPKVISDLPAKYFKYSLPPRSHFPFMQKYKRWPWNHSLKLVGRTLWWEESSSGWRRISHMVSLWWEQWVVLLAHRSTIYHDTIKVARGTSQMRGQLKTKCMNAIGGHYGIPGGKGTNELSGHVNWLLQDSNFIFGGLNLTVGS